MAEPVSTASAVTAGVMIATGSTMANLVILNDSTYMYLSAVGAFVSMFGVIHEILSNGDAYNTWHRICSEICKGLVLGVLAIPMFYLTLTSFGEDIVEKVFEVESRDIENSVWLMVSFGMSWYTVPIYDWIVLKVKRVFTW